MLISDSKDFQKIELTVNNQKITSKISTSLRLLDFIRNELDLTGAKEVCAEGECGACTVIMDGKIVNSCLVLAVEADGSEVTTIEGIGKDEGLSELQQAFVDYHSVQCGYCIPGMLISLYALMKQDPHIDEEAIRHALFSKCI